LNIKRNITVYPVLMPSEIIMIGICLSYKQSNTSKIDRQEHQKTPKKINPPYFCSIARIESVLRFKTDGKRTKNHKYKE